MLAPVTVVSRVSASSDDAEQRLRRGSVNLTSTDMELGADNGRLQLVGLRFNNLDIPQGSVIIEAYIEFEVDVTNSESTSVIFRGQASDNPATFVRQSDNISSRPMTSASVAWNNLASWLLVNEKRVTPDLSVIVQEIVNRPSWATGNSLVIFIESSGERTAEAYDGESANAPLLVVSYGPPEATTTAASLIVSWPLAMALAFLGSLIVGVPKHKAVRSPGLPISGKRAKTRSRSCARILGQ